MNLDFVSVHKHAKKELGQYPAILTSHLVNNPYVSDLTAFAGCMRLIPDSPSEERIWVGGYGTD